MKQLGRKVVSAVLASLLCVQSLCPASFAHAEETEGLSASLATEEYAELQQSDDGSASPAAEAASGQEDGADAGDSGEPEAASEDDEATLASSYAGDEAGSDDSESADAPVPGADAPVSPTDSTNELDLSLLDFFTEDTLTEALISATANADGSIDFATLLAYADQYVGLEYVWGGKDLSRDGGFDCSGFVCWVFNNVAGTGINSDYTSAAAIYANWCTPVSESEAQPGDIVFFKGTYGSNLNYITHVGIYCGNGIMIDAGDPIGYHSIYNVHNVNGGTATHVFGRMNGVTINPVINIADSGSLYVSDAYLGGSSAEPAAHVVVLGRELAQGTDYEVSYADNTAVGTGTVTVTGKGYYMGSLSATFNVLDSADAPADGRYYICSTASSEEALVLDIRSASTSSGAVLQLYGQNESAAQRFAIALGSDGYYTIKNVNSGLYLTCSDLLSLGNGTSVTQQASNGGYSQKWVFRKSGDAYQIVSAWDASIVLDTPSGNATGGVSLQMWASNDTAAQKWSLSLIETEAEFRARLDELASANKEVLADGSYVVSSANSSTAVLDNASASSANGTKLQLWTANETDAQVWRVSHDELGYVTLTNAATGLVVDLPSALASSGAALHLWQSNGSYAQKWIAVEEDGAYKLVSAVDDAFVMDACAGATADGTTIDLYGSNGSKAQRWVFSPYTPMRDRLDALASANKDVLADGTYAVCTALNSTSVLDVASGGTANGTAVQLWQANGTDAQVWTVTHDEKGYITFIGAGSGLALDVRSASTASGTGIDVYSSNGTYAQKWIAVKDGDSYKLVSGLSDSMVLDVSSGSTSDGAAIQIWTSNDTKAQRWTFVETTTRRGRLDALAAENANVLADGTYAVYTALNSASVLDVAAGSTANGASVQLYAFNATGAQQWTVSHDEQGYVTLTNASSGKALDVCGADASSGAKVDIYDPNGTYAQKWIAVKDGDSYKLVSGLSDTLVLDVAAGSTANGAAIQLYAGNDSLAQRWVFQTEEARRAELDALAAENQDVLEDGTYSVYSALNRVSVIDVVSGGTQNGTSVQLYYANATEAQIWTVSHDAKGYVTLTNEGSGRVLDVRAGSLSAGTGVDIYDSNNTYAQKWIAVKDDGTYKLVSALSKDLVLDVASGNVANGTAVQIWTSNDSSAQRWVFDEPRATVTEKSYGYSLSAAATASTSTLTSYGVGASASDVKSALDPSSRGYGTSEFNQFADLRSGLYDVTGDQLDYTLNKYDYGRNGVFLGQGSAIVQAAQSHGINPCYFFAHMMTETAWGSSSMARGKYFEAGYATIKVNGEYYQKWVEAGTYYNFIGWGAYDSDPDTAYDFSRYYGWNSVSAALDGAAEKLATYYINAGQETIYEMRWNPDYLVLYPFASTVSHQYCTSLTWCDTIAQIMANTYKVNGVTPTTIYTVPSYSGN